MGNYYSRQFLSKESQLFERFSTITSPFPLVQCSTCHSVAWSQLPDNSGLVILYGLQEIDNIYFLPVGEFRCLCHDCMDAIFPQFLRTP